MIWYVIGYFAMSFISGPLVALYAMRMAKQRGYNADDIITYMLTFHVEREVKHVDDNTSRIAVIRSFVVNIVFWPVKVLRMIFVDIPNAIELYEAQYIVREEA